MFVLNYLGNLVVALYNLEGAILFVYRPNGDGWLHSIFYCLDCMGNALAGGDPRETISSRAGKAKAAGQRWGCYLCRLLDLVQRDHCQRAVDKSRGGAAVVPDATVRD